MAIDGFDGEWLLMIGHTHTHHLLWAETEGKQFGILAFGRQRKQKSEFLQLPGTESAGERGPPRTFCFKD